VLILKGLSWLLMARFTPYSRADVAQMWPRGREGKAAIQWLWRGRGRVSCYASVVLLSIAFTTFKIKQLEVIVLSLVVQLVAKNLIQFQSDMVLATDTRSCIILSGGYLR
jgi:hypothetical protein